MDSTAPRKRDLAVRTPQPLSEPSLPEPESAPSEPSLKDRVEALLRDKRHTSLTRAPAQGGFLHRVCYTITKAELDLILRNAS